MNSVLDSNMLIYYLNQALPEHAKQRVKQAIIDGAAMSVITRLEVLGWHDCTEQEFERAAALLKQLAEIPLTETIVKYCITIRRTHRIKLPDAIIAATALESDLPLLTRNTDDFKTISGLNIVNPFEE